ATRQDNMADIKVLSARAPQMALQRLFSDFAAATRHAVAPVYGTVGAIAGRFRAGEGADLLVLSPQALAALGHALASGSTAPSAPAGPAVAVRQGAPAPGSSPR